MCSVLKQLTVTETERELRGCDTHWRLTILTVGAWPCWTGRAVTRLCAERGFTARACGSVARTEQRVVLAPRKCARDVVCRRSVVQRSCDHSDARAGTRARSRAQREASEVSLTTRHRHRAPYNMPPGRSRPRWVPRRRVSRRHVRRRRRVGTAAREMPWSEAAAAAPKRCAAPCAAASVDAVGLHARHARGSMRAPVDAALPTGHDARPRRVCKHASRRGTQVPARSSRAAFAARSSSDPWLHVVPSCPSLPSSRLRSRASPRWCWRPRAGHSRARQIVAARVRPCMKMRSAAQHVAFGARESRATPASMAA